MPGPIRRRGPALRAALIAAVVVAALFGTDARGSEAAEPSSMLIGCERATERVVLTDDAHLDPSCVYEGGFRIEASDVTLDCEGALIQFDGGGRGIEIATPVDVDMSGVVVRNCRIDGFLNSIKLTRDGFRDLPSGVEYDHHLSGAVIEDNELSNSHGVGIFVDAYVSDTTIRDNTIRGAGSTGIYLETGSRASVVTDNRIVDNGFRENGPGGQVRRVGDLRFRWWGSGREGLAIDGSYDNVVTDNRFEGNSAGGVFLYKNCGEYPEAERYFERRFPSDNNLIADNTFIGGDHGVWIGQRMAENTYFMECTDEPYVTGPFLLVVPDFAKHNVVADNRFVGVTYGVRVEDDHNTVVDNRFEGPSPDHHAVVVGTRVRTDVLDHPVTDTLVANNTSTIVGNTHPYRWVHGHRDLDVRDNTALGAPVGICEGEELPYLGSIWVIAVAVEPPGSPVTPPPPDLAMPTLGALDPCPAGEEPIVVPGGVTLDEATGEAVVPYTLSAPADRTVTMQWRTLSVPALVDPAPAEVDTDFVPTEGTVTFPVGETAAEARIPIVDDDHAEHDELFVLFPGPATNARIGGFWGLGIVIITDDD